MRIRYFKKLRNLLFQSTPPVAGGRCSANNGVAVVPSRFNPRPPLPGGDAIRKPSDLGYSDVSIHAPRCRGAMPSGALWIQRPGHLFQSTPPVAGGRCHLNPAIWQGMYRFNPRPPLPGGDAKSSGAVSAFDGVSIHAPRCRGAMPGRAARRRSPCTRFNPRPPLPGGDASNPADRQTKEIVSIHAPRCRGAMPTATASSPTASSGFNPRPPLPGGDAAARPSAVRRWSSFNPRPPLPGGDARRSGTSRPVKYPFQSTPPVAGGRCWCRPSIRAQRRMFQSTPPVAGGRCPRH